LGIKPFHFAWHNGCFLFGSEIKAILAAGFPAEANRSTWATYLTHGYYDHGVETFFEGISALAPGHTLTLDRGRATIRKYWDLPALAAEPLILSDDEAAGQFLELFEDAVRLRLRSDVPLGVNLSGGLDSASLMVTADTLLRHEGEVQTFTASFSDPKYDEHDFASQVRGDRLWVRNVQRVRENEIWDLARDALWFQEAPYGGISTLAYHLLHRLSKELGVTVLLEGQGVDETLAGYDYFRPFYYLDLLQNGHGQALRRELKAERDYGRGALDTLRRMLSGEPENVYQDGTSYLQPGCIRREVRGLAGDLPEFPRVFADHLTNALYRDLRFTKLPRVLRMNDRLSMAFGRELREPYLDHRIVEFLFRLPGHQKIRLGRGKFLLRHAMVDRLPQQVRLAEKRGVVTPQREWLRELLRSNVKELIHSQSFARRELFDAKEVRSAYTRFCKGEGENAFFVWQWVNTELWFRCFIDGEGWASRGMQPVRN
jgi:asparagine synthase (glutamine-hydrolysing)